MCVARRCLLVVHVRKRPLAERRCCPAGSLGQVSSGLMPAEHVIVMSTTDSVESARALAASAIEAELGACAQIVGPITSVFRWEGEIRTEQEWRVEIKTSGAAAQPLTELLEAAHTYDVPEIVTTPITGGSSAYLAWLTDETNA